MSYDDVNFGHQAIPGGHCLCCGKLWCDFWNIAPTRAEENGINLTVPTFLGDPISGSFGYALNLGATVIDVSGVSRPMSSRSRPVDALNRPEGPQGPEILHAVPYHSAHVPHHAVILDSESNAQLSEADNHSTTVGSPFMILPQEKYKTRLLSVTLLPPVHFYGFGLRSALDEKTGGLVDGDGAAFEEGVVLPQKMTIMLLFPGCTRYKRQANILRARAKPPTRAQLSAIIAREVLRFLTQARQEGTPLRFQGHEICGLEDLVLIDVFHVSKSSLQPVIGMAGAV